MVKSIVLVVSKVQQVSQENLNHTTDVWVSKITLQSPRWSPCPKQDITCLFVWSRNVLSVLSVVCKPLKCLLLLVKVLTQSNISGSKWSHSTNLAIALQQLWWTIAHKFISCLGQVLTQQVPLVIRLKSLCSIWNKPTDTQRMTLITSRHWLCKNGLLFMFKIVTSTLLLHPPV